MELNDLRITKISPYYDYRSPCRMLGHIIYAEYDAPVKTHEIMAFMKNSKEFESVSEIFNGVWFDWDLSKLSNYQEEILICLRHGYDTNAEREITF